MTQKLPRTMFAVRKAKNEPGLWPQADTPVPTLGPRDALIAVTQTEGGFPWLVVAL